LIALGTRTLDVGDPVLREAARRMGFIGPLRGELRRLDARGASRTPADVLTDVLGGDLDVSVGRRRSGLVALARAAVSGLAEMTDVVFIDRHSGRRLRAFIPSRPDLMIDRVGETVDTTFRIMRDFGAAVPPLREIRFDHASHGLKQRTSAGEANLAAIVIHLSASLVCAEEWRALEREREIRAHRARPAQVTGAFTYVDGVTAHEVWHQMEAAFESRRYRDSIEFRRRLGEYFGVATLEHVVDGRNPAARARLAEEVSEYAATARLEATAEMLKLGWCRTGKPVGVVALFGDLVRQFLLSGG
jgi:hypothetical protein